MLSEETANALECAILGGILLEPEIIDSLRDLTTDDFYSERARIVYAAMLEVREDREPLNRLTIETRLGEVQYATIGGTAYIAMLDEWLPSTDSIPAAVRALREHSARRRAISASALFAHRAETRPLAETLDSHIASLEELRGAMPSGARSFVPTSTSATDSVLDVSARRPHAMTGIPALDRAGHLEIGTVTVIAGRPGEGKSALGLQALAFSAINRGLPSAYLSYEMATPELIERLVSSRARVDYDTVRDRSFSSQQRSACQHALSEIRRAPIFIDDHEGRTMGEFARDLRRLKAEHRDLILAVVDQLSLMPFVGESKDRWDQRVGTLVKHLVRLARELELALAVLVQLNRAPQREERFPILSDLSNSDEIGQHSHAVVAIHRPPIPEEPGQPGRRGWLGVLKHRGGKLFRVPIEFWGEVQAFVEIDEQREVTEAPTEREGGRIDDR